jgi:cytidine deaminase
MSLSPVEQALVQAARAARAHAYAPYSGYAVGAAVLTDDGRVFAGCNVENASYGLSICAERVAVFSAVASGARRLVAAAVCTPTAEPPAARADRCCWSSPTRLTSALCGSSRLTA